MNAQFTIVASFPPPVRSFTVSRSAAELSPERKSYITSGTGTRSSFSSSRTFMRRSPPPQFTIT